MSLRKASILKLASAAYEMGLQVLRGELERGLGGQLQVNQRSLADWLREMEGQEVVLIAASLDDDREPVVRTCRTCGREYVEHECPHCRESRIRLRGQ
jgi:Zn finger protein HypA/HybF involved in hydrogenase expression